MAYIFSTERSPAAHLNQMRTAAMYIKQTGEDTDRVFYFFNRGRDIEIGKGVEARLGRVIS